MDNFIQITAFCRPKPGANTFADGRKATVYAWKTNDLLKRTFSMKLTTKEKKRKCTLYVCKQSGNRLVISANVGLIKGFSFQHKHIISYLQITEANIYKLFIKQGCYLFLFFLRGNLIIFQPHPQGAFPWLWRWDGPPKPGKSALGTRLLIFESCPSLSVPLWIPFRDRLKSFPQPLTMVLCVYEDLSLLDSEYGESGREGYTPKVEHCEKLGSNLNKGCDA